MFEKHSWYHLLPDENLDICTENYEMFFRTMYERQMIWKRRFIDKQERPWTDDAILRDYKFTNVYRELDRNSQWQIKNILLDGELDLRNLIWKMMVFRFFNNPETFEFDPKNKELQGDLFGDKVRSGLKQINDFNDCKSAKDWRNGIPSFEEYDEAEFSQFIAGVRSVGLNPFTTAYLINSQATPGQSRDYCYTRVVIPYLHSKMDELIKIVRAASDPMEIIKYLKTFPSVQDFIAHEFYQDFTYIPRYTDKQFMLFDQNDYTNVGPGASIGIRLIYPNLKTLKEQKHAIYRLKEKADEELSKIGEFSYLHWDKPDKNYIVSNDKNYAKRHDTFIHSYGGITLHQIEMWLCEFQKYWKMTHGEGKQRSKFSIKTKV